MDYREDIEQLVKNTFDNFESEVSPDAWTNIQNGLNIQPGPGSGLSGNTVSTGAKLTGAASKFSVVNIIGTAAAIVGITASVIYFSSDNNPGINHPANGSKTVENSVQEASTEMESSRLIDNPNETKAEKSVASLKQEVDTKKAVSSGNESVYRSATSEDVPVASMDKKDVTNLAGDKNIPEQVKPVNRTQLAAAKVEDEKSKVSNNLEEESLKHEAETEAPENVEQKSAAYYLGNVPNVITPNGDENNDVFIIDGNDLLSLKVSIYDQATGKMIHQWNNLHGFWDGKTENGQAAKEGMYIYNIFAQPKTGKPITKTGTLHLILN